MWGGVKAPKAGGRLQGSRQRWLLAGYWLVSGWFKMIRACMGQSLDRLCSKDAFLSCTNCFPTFIIPRHLQEQACPRCTAAIHLARRCLALVWILVVEFVYEMREFAERGAGLAGASVHVGTGAVGKDRGGSSRNVPGL